MRITDVSVTMFAWDGIPKAQYSDRNPATTGRSELGLLAIETEAGVTGHAFIGASFRSARLDVRGIIDVLKPVLMGRDAMAREARFQDVYRLRRAVTNRTIGAVDVALWDIAGKVANLPLHRLMGSFRRSVPAYASSSRLPGLDDYRRQFAKVRERGFRAYKLHPPSDVDQTIALCRAIRADAGPDYVLMIDPSMAHRLPEAMRLGRVLEELGFAWYEDPLSEEDIHNYVELKAKLDIPILATEYAAGGFESFPRWITAHATDFLRGDVAVKGGLTPLLKAAHLAEAFQMTLEVHHGGNSHNNVAQLHLIMALSNARYFEILLPDDAQKYGLLRDIELEADGTIAIDAFDKPGVGAEIDFDLVKAKTVEVLR